MIASSGDEIVAGAVAEVSVGWGAAGTSGEGGSLGREDHIAPQGHCGASGLDGGTAELPHMPSAAAPEEAAGVLVRENKEALRQVPALMFHVDEVRER